MPEATRDIYCNPGDTTPVSGIYDVIHSGHVLDGHQVTMVKGHRVPPCRTCAGRVRYKLYYFAAHVGEDLYLAD